MNNNEYCYYALLIPCFDNIAACKKKKKVSSGHIPNRFDILLKQIEEITLEQLKRL